MIKLMAGYDFSPLWYDNGEKVGDINQETFRFLVN